MRWLTKRIRDLLQYILQKSIERGIKYSLYLGQEEGAAAFPEEYEFPTMEQLGEQVSLTPPLPSGSQRSMSSPPWNS